MMPLPSDNTPSKKDQENSETISKKTTRPTPPPEHGIKCPRCDSPNTKFCYYNNYSLTQPRHFCKTCRRYWTNGGALRNVPIGGGCRKSKKAKTSASSSTSSSPLLSRLSSYDHSNNRDSAFSSSTSSYLAGLRFFHSINSPSLEFHLGGLPFNHHHQQQQPSFITGMNIYNQFSSINGDVSNSTSIHQLDPNSLMGTLNYPLSGFNGGNTANAIQGGMNSMNLNTTLASSIESLSSINQDLHLKLQQQRLATLFGGENQKDSTSNVSLLNIENQTLKPQPLLFQNLEISKPEMFQNGENSRKEGTTSGGDAVPVLPPMEWFFGNSNYCSVTPATTTTTNGSDNIIANNNWNNSGVHAWGDVQQQQQPYSALP